MTRGHRRLFLLVGAALLLDTTFYAVITPLLPQLSHQLHLSKLSAGVLTGGYPAGTVLASLPAGALAVRMGPRVTVLTGLTLLVVSTVAFALLDTAVALDLARVLEGVGGACTWSGGLAWLIAVTAPERRGAVLGAALGAATVGGLFGPAVGAVASAIGRGPLFCGLAAFAVVLIVPVMRSEDRQESPSQSLTSVWKALRRRPFQGALWVTVLPAIVAGAYEVLGSLRLHELGAGAGVIGATFLVAAGIEAGISTLTGRLSDRLGRMPPLRVALIGLPVALACFTLPSSAGALVALMIVTATVLALFWAPAMALTSDLAERYRIDQAHAAALLNLAWGLGQIIGSAGGGAVAKGFGDEAATLAIATLCVLTLLWLRRDRFALPA